MQNSLLRYMTTAAVAASVLTLGAVAPNAVQAGGTAQPVRTCASTTNFTLYGYEEATILLDKGDTLTVSLIIREREVYGSTIVQPAPLAIEASALIVYAGDKISVANGASQQIVGDGINLSADIYGAAIQGSASISEVTISCLPAGSGQAVLADNASTIGANSQTGATRTGISRNTQNRLGGGGGNAVTRNSVFVSTQGQPDAASQFGQPQWNAWISGEARQYSGDLDGWSADAVAGVDTLVGDDMVLGALLAYGRVDIENSTDSAAVTSVALGAYFAKRFQSDLFLDGFISVARPEYETAGTTFSSSRTSASLALTGSYSGGNFKVTPSGKLSTYREDLPAYTGTSGAVAANSITNVNLNIGAKVEPLLPMANGILPYISLGVDYGRNTSTASGTVDFTAPRIGFGFGKELDAGYLSFDVDAGEVQDGVRDVGFRATYEFNF